MPIWGGSGSGSGGTGLTLIFSSTLAAPAANIDTGAGGISQGFTHLVCFCALRTGAAGTDTRGGIRFNNDSGANYMDVLLAANNSSATAGQAITATSIDIIPEAAASATANAFAMSTIYIPYYKTGSHKVAICSGFNPASELTATMFERVSSGAWANTAAITRMAVLDSVGAGTLQTGSALHVYGV